MKRNVALSLLAVAVSMGVFLSQTRAACSVSVFATTLTVDRTDDIASATACTGAANDCSLRLRSASNANVSSTEVIIELQSGVTYNLTLTNATQENAALTGDLDIVATHHAVTINGGVSAATIQCGRAKRRQARVTVCFTS